MNEDEIETKIERIMTSEYKGKEIWSAALSFIFKDIQKRVSIYRTQIANEFEISIWDMDLNMKTNWKTFGGLPNNQSITKSRAINSMLNSTGIANKNAPELLEHFSAGMLKHLNEISEPGTVIDLPEPTDFFDRVPNPSWKGITTNMRKYLHIKDETPYITGQACLLASKIPEGEMVWLGVIGPSGMGKSLFSNYYIPGDNESNAWAVERSDFTSKALVTGREDTEDMVKDFQGKLLIIGDFTLLLGKKPEEINSILAQLRLMHDGRYIKSFGSGVGTKAHYTKFGMLFNVTNKIDTLQNEIAILGPRNIHVRFEESTPEFSEKLAHAAYMGDDNSKWEKKISDEMLSMYEKFDPKKLSPIPERYAIYIEYCALITANLRIPIERDQWLPGRPVKLYPLREEAGRLVKVFKKMGQCITHVLGKKEFDDEVLSCIYRLAIDTPDFMRVAIFRTLKFDAMKIEDISGAVHLDEIIVKMLLEELQRAHLIKIVDEVKVVSNQEGTATGVEKTGDKLYYLDKKSHVLRYVIGLETALGHLEGKERHHNLMNFDPAELYKHMNSDIPKMTKEELEGWIEEHGMDDNYPDEDPIPMMQHIDPNVEIGHPDEYDRSILDQGEDERESETPEHIDPNVDPDEATDPNQEE